jgi:hypothetical protein
VSIVKFHERPADVDCSSRLLASAVRTTPARRPVDLPWRASP